MPKFTPITQSEIGVGRQVLYVPYHLQNKEDVTQWIEYPGGCQEGFIMSLRSNDGETVSTAFCRYFYPKEIDHGSLRTKANSEGCDPSNLMAHIHHPQEEIDRLVDDYSPRINFASIRRQLNEDPSLAAYMLRDLLETRELGYSDLMYTLGNGQYSCHKNDVEPFLNEIEELYNKKHPPVEGQNG